jgi:hypothetical protein
MNLEHELRSLPIAFPSTPDLEGRVLARLDERRSRRPWVVLAVAAVAAIGALFAIPQTRAAILDFFRIGGEEIRRVETQPRAPERSPRLGRAVTLDEAREAVDFEVLVPDADVDAFLDDAVPGRMVNLRWNGYLLSQWRGDQIAFVTKQLGPGSKTVSFDVDGARGLWITGARHEIVYRAPSGEVIAKTRRLVGNVLVWDRDGITYRLEGPGTSARALAIARNLERP